jgi:DNA polymerase-3 subunit alpha
MTDFVHLHVHSDYSLLDGAASVESLAAKAASLGMRHLAITDHGNLFAVLEFKEACEKAGIHPIIGSEFYMAPGARTDRKGGENGNKYYHLVLLSTCERGYRNLLKLSSYSFTEGFYYKPRLDKELLERYAEGLIGLSACLAGEIPSLILERRVDEAEKRARWFRDVLGQDNFYLELQDHRLPEQQRVNPVIVELARRTGIPLVATNDIHYMEREDAPVQDILLCISTKKLRKEEKRLRFATDEFYFKTGEEMAALFPEYPEAISNTVRIAERCKTEIPQPGPLLPDFEIPPEYGSANDYLRHLTMEGLEGRYPGIPREVRERAEYELGIITSMDFTGYFLIVADFINWAKAHGIPVGPGRGSGAASIVAYALKITDINPLQYGLLFERFLNPERISMPDFDVDFCYERRGEVIEYVTQKYGKNRVGQIITLGTLKAKAVITDVARVLDIPLSESEMIAKLIPEDPKMTLGKALEQEPKLLELAESSRYQELFAIARKLEGKNRNSSLHAAGIVIGKTDLTDYVPLYWDPKTQGVASQFTMDKLEPCGLVKMDFLGLKTLTLIKHTEELIRRRGGEYAGFSIAGIPETDKAVFEMMGEGKSAGVFQFESPGMQKVLKKARPTSIEDLIALNALYRPGPMDNIDQFVDCKWGRKPIEYPHPVLEEVLKETYGVIVYQEQVMQVARIIAGYSLGQADILRKAMGKKKLEVMKEEKAKFIAGAREKGFTAEKADEIFEILIPFAGYGFNKAHSTCYAILAYQTAYLKANFPAEFMAANLSNEITSVDKLPQYIDEARRMGIPLDPPDINRSGPYFTVAGGRIVYGFLGIKGLGDASAEEIVNCRGDGPYKNFMEFLDRVNIKTVGKKVVELLIQTGAFDGFGVPRATLAHNLEKAVDCAQNKKDDKKYGQSSLFEETGEKEYPDFVFEEVPEWDRAERLRIEKELIGFYFSGHPLDDYRELWQKTVKVDLGKPETLNQRNTILVGIIKTVKIITTPKGARMAYASLADYNGEIELTIFPSAWEKCQDKIEVDKVTILEGKIEYQKDKDRRCFIVDNHIAPEDVENAVKEEDARSRKWDKYRNILKYSASLDLRLLDLSNPAGAEAGTYTVIGLLKSIRTHNDKKGNEMAFGTLEDNRGEINLVFFSRVWESCKAIIAVDEIVAFKGNIDPAQDKNPARPGFVVSSFQDANKLVKAAAKEAARAADADPAGETAPRTDEVPARKEEPARSPQDAERREVHIRLKSDTAEREETLYPLRDYLADNPGPCSVFIHVPVAGGETVIRTTTHSAAANDSAVDGLTRCAGVARVWCE